LQDTNVPTYSDITCEFVGSVARLTVNRPDKLNAYRNETADELRAAIENFVAGGDVRAILITGAGRAFGAGYDLSTIDPAETPALDQVLDRHFNPLIRAMRASPIPIVAAVNGPCAGAAVGVALGADIVIAARSAYFYEPFVGIALVPDAGNTLFLTRMLGRGRAAGMMMLGDRITAERALSWGLIWDVVDDDALAETAMAACSKIAGLDPSALAGTKRLITEAGDGGLDALLDHERDLQGEAGRTTAMKAQIVAFFASRKG
jgi:2-(1,2-epoxy-1,2-dihydrophenyl)acetyl-CoA isomerase